MSKIVLIPDSFKGTMSSGEICLIMKQAILRHLPHAEIVSIPVADGGEGSVDAFLAAMGGRKIPVTVKGPYFEEVDAFYAILPDGTAVVEMAAAAGLPLVGENLHAERTTTFGVGQLIAHAVGAGCKRVIVGLGGSATNDGGTGAAAALGVQFYNAAGQTFVPVGATLNEITSVELGGLSPAVQAAEIITMCDIDNPLCGPRGAAAVFGPQKGAGEAMVQTLDANLLHLASVIERCLGKQIAHLPGAGAAGGMGGGMVAFLGSSLQMGIEVVLNTVQFDHAIQGASLVLTGEGKFDSQSLGGKVVIGVARRAKKQGIPAVAVVGDIGDAGGAAYDEGVSAIFSINTLAIPFAQAKQRCREDLALTMDNLMRFWVTAGQKGGTPQA